MLVLLVVDMQVGLFEGGRRYDADGVVARINDLVDGVRDRLGRVVFVRHNGGEGTNLVPGTPQWEILPSLHREDGDGVVDKTVCDAFYKTDLDARLQEMGCDELVIVGCCTDFCMDTTIRAAANRGYSVTAPSDCHTTENRPHMEAGLVVLHHSWVWGNMSVGSGAIRVVPAAELLQSLE